MKKFVSFFATAAVLFTGCAVQTTAPLPPSVATATTPVVEVIETFEYSESSARLLEPEQKMLLTTVIADLKVSEEKIYHTETEAFAKFKVTPALLNNIAEWKKIAVSRAIKAYKADVLVGATFEVVTKNGRLEITVSGYPAYYTKFRNVTAADIELLKETQTLTTPGGADAVKGPESIVNVNVKK